ncbi:MAG: cyclic pyranopterin phosphate synthase [Bradyrhizobium sp.]|nr:cyclic pyranopterin phosphate synthase [Bradyrhizobium sp.]
MTTLAPLVDPFDRAIASIRVTDRDDLGGVCRLTGHHKFLPRPKQLAIEELDRFRMLLIGLRARRHRLAGGALLRRWGHVPVRPTGRAFGLGCRQGVIARRQSSRARRMAPLLKQTGDPVRHVRWEETGELGSISHAYFLRLDRDDAADLCAPLRCFRADYAAARAATREGIARKPTGNGLQIDRRGAVPAVSRPMSMAGA